MKYPLLPASLLGNFFAITCLTALAQKPACAQSTTRAAAELAVASSFAQSVGGLNLVTQLRTLKSLPKVHYSWPLPPAILESADDSHLFEYVRITHAASISGEWATSKHVKAVVRACKRVNEDGASIPASIAINYSPWHREFDKELPPTDVGPTHHAELARFRMRLQTIKQWLLEENREQGAAIAVTAILLDSERFYVVTQRGDPAWNPAITAKYDAIHDIASELFPGARIEWYGLGIQESANAEGWSPFPWHTFANKATTFSCSLYRVPEIGTMRDTFRRTAAKARAHGITEVTPWVALAAGYRRKVDAFQEWDSDWDYDLVYSWMLGAELNEPWYGERPERFAPWNVSKVVVFYPPPFDPRSPQWGKHFVAYVRGASGIKSLPE